MGPRITGSTGLFIYGFQAQACERALVLEFFVLIVICM